MLSVLIPTYNYNVYPLVAEIHKQCNACKIEFEIIVIDDCSPIKMVENNKINDFKGCTLLVLDKNKGRSAVRNTLAQKATFDWLLYLDSDVLPTNSTFISNYLPYITTDIKLVNGGIKYQSIKPEKSKLLRWKYGIDREALDVEARSKNSYLSCLSLNFLIHKSILELVKFNESIPNLRHEDTLFSYNLKQKNVIIKHINNPVLHLGLDEFEKAIKKEKESLFALTYLLNNNLIAVDYIRMGKFYFILKKYRLTSCLNLFHKITLPLLLKNLQSSHPSLTVFDLYRLGYLCTLKLDNHV